MKDKLAIALGVQMAQRQPGKTTQITDPHSEITRPFSLKDPKAIVDELFRLKKNVIEPDGTGEPELLVPEEDGFKKVDIADIFKSLREKE